MRHLRGSNARLQYDENEKRWDAVGNSSERPLVVAAQKAGYEVAKFEGYMPRLKENPFSSARKMMSVVVDCSRCPNDIKSRVFLPEHMGTPYAAVVKGAPTWVVKKCTSMLASDGRSATDMTAAMQQRIEQGGLDQVSVGLRNLWNTALCVRI